MTTMRYRLSLDLGSTSLGWAMVRLNADNAPCAVIKAGVRIFSDGRNPKDGSSLAVSPASLDDWDVRSGRNHS
jgi:CRISPR-associated endonuclease Csn1